MYIYLSPDIWNVLFPYVRGVSGILARVSRLQCVKCKRKLQQSDAEMMMNVWENLTAEIPFTQCTHHALHYTNFYINFISFFFFQPVIQVIDLQHLYRLITKDKYRYK